MKVRVWAHSVYTAFVIQFLSLALFCLFPFSLSFPFPPSLPLTTQLLMVPTPFFIGVHNSFLSKIGASRHSEAWMINLDTKHFEPPSMSDQQHLPEFPYSILQLQADIRKVGDTSVRVLTVPGSLFIRH